LVKQKGKKICSFPQKTVILQPLSRDDSMKFNF